jgi:imidazole glycerol-phosphate synthase subunit HisH
VNAAIQIVATGVANTASVAAAFARLGCTANTCTDAATLSQAAFVVLPGVGAFGAAMAELTRLSLVQALQQRFAAGRPTLAICLGMQLLATASDESPGIAGLAVLPGTVRRLPATVPVPQLGWNRVRADADPDADTDPLLGDGTVYFANSYCLTEPPPGWRCAFAEHGGRFVAALARGGVLACQFHPELSGAEGASWLQRWLNTAAVR